MVTGETIAAGGSTEIDAKNQLKTANLITDAHIVACGTMVFITVTSDLIRAVENCTKHNNTKIQITCKLKCATNQWNRQAPL